MRRKKNRVHTTVTTTDHNISLLFWFHLLAAVPYYPLLFSLWNPQNSSLSPSPSICFPLNFGMHLSPSSWGTTSCLGRKKIPGATHRGTYKEHKPARAPAATPPALLWPYVPKTPRHLKGIKIWTYLRFPLKRKKKKISVGEEGKSQKQHLCWDQRTRSWHLQSTTSPSGNQSGIPSVYKSQPK